MKKTQYIILITLHLSLITLLTSCEKVSPIGVLVAGTGVEDRVMMSNIYFQQQKGDYYHFSVDADEYTFLVGADSHMTTDAGRMEEMFQIGLDNNDLLYAHLGDIADTKAEYYVNLDNVVRKYKKKYGQKYYKEIYLGDDENVSQLNNDDYYVYVDTITNNVYDVNTVPFPFFPVVGNHDITHNGWALWSNIFHSSFYSFYVYIAMEGHNSYYDHFIFLDTANGTLGQEQVDLIEAGVLDDKSFEDAGIYTRNTFVFSHTNIFRPSSLQFASTFPREETLFLLNQFVKWNTSIVFCGHVHKWDEQEVGGVHYITLDSMSERNSPGPGDYLVRVHVKKDGTITWERVHMNYTVK